MEKKNYVQRLTGKVLCATQVELLMSGIFSVSSFILLPGKIFSVSRQIKSALADCASLQVKCSPSAAILSTQI